MSIILRRYAVLFHNKKLNLIQKYSQNVPEFTKNVYKVFRGNYNQIKTEHIQYFQSILGAERVITDPTDLEKYNVDWFFQVRGASTVVLKPKSTEEISKILQFCNLSRLAVCPQGGNTGVLGGAVPVFDEIVLSTDLMNKIIGFDENSGIITCQAGCILENIDKYLETKGFTVPLDIGSKGSCHIGGNVSTNAGGIRMIKFGNMHGNVLGLEVVKANGEIIDCLSTLKKDNTGYHLKHLFIGSEGTLGVVTKVSLQCPARSKFKNVAFLGLQNFENVLETFKLLKQRLSEIISAVEVIDTPTMEFIQKNIGQSSPIGEYPFYLLIETLGNNEKHDDEKLNGFFEDALNKGLVMNGTVASEPAKIKSIWSIRENIANGFRLYGSRMLHYDISLPLKNYYDMLKLVKENTKGLTETVFGFGHLGDSNLHLEIILKNEITEDIRYRIDSIVLDSVLKLHGSLSAEHGIGLLKAKYMDKIKPPNSIKLMKSMKKLLDPNGILNPYKVLI